LLDAVRWEGGREGERGKKRVCVNGTMRAPFLLNNSSLPPSLPPSFLPSLFPFFLYSSSLLPLGDAYVMAQHVEMADVLSFLEKGDLMR